MRATDGLLSGTISEVLGYGTVVQLLVTTDEGRLAPIHLDNRPFCWLLDAEQSEPRDLVGRAIEYDGESIRFLD